MSINAKILPKVMELLEEVIRYYKNLQGNPAGNRDGGYLTVGLIEETIPRFTVMIGNPAEKKRERYYKNSLEKFFRLLKKIAKGHISSYQSKDEVNETFGGAIIADGYIFSFSGFPEDGDEAIMIGLAYKLGRISAEEIKAIEAASNNKVIGPLLKAMGYH